MSHWKAERFSYLEEVIAFLNTRQLESHQFKIVTATDDRQRPFIVFVAEPEPIAMGAIETVAEVAEPPSGGAIEAAEAIVADAQREDE